MLLPFTMKITISAMLVAWSAIRSRYFETKSCAVPDHHHRRVAPSCGRGARRTSARAGRRSSSSSLADRERQIGVLAHEGVEALAQHLAHRVRHPRQIDLQRRSASRRSSMARSQMLTAMSPIALEIGRDLQAGRDQAQIARRGLVQREQAQALLVDVDVVAVDLVIALDRRFGERRDRATRARWSRRRSAARRARPSRGCAGEVARAPPRTVDPCAVPSAAPQPNRPVM